MARAGRMKHERARTIFAPVMLALICLALLSCAERKVAQRAAPHPDARTERIFVATLRELDKTGPTFGAERPQDLRYLRVDVSVPPTHQSGHVEWPEGPPDAATDFVVTETEIYASASAMLSLMPPSAPGRETLVYVHGYNNTLSDAVFRLAQIQTDFATGRPSVLFSWPSAGDPRGYVYDRDSILYSRDDFQAVLHTLTAAPGDKVLLLAHSMGAHLVMEVLRQAALRGDRRLLNRISGVILMSPDIDPQLFRRQAEAIGTLPQPFLIFVSRQDRALNLASFISGRKPRLGVIDGPDKLAGLDVKVIDFTRLGDGEGLNHAIPATSPAAISVLRGMIAQAQAGTPAFENYMVLEAQ